MRPLSTVDAAAKHLLTIRFRYYLRRLVLPLVEETVCRGLTVEEWAEEFVATFEGPLPPRVQSLNRSSRRER